MNRTGRAGPLIAFLGSYLGFALAELVLPPQRSSRILSLGMLGGMIMSVRWAQRRQDEVLRAVSARANEIGFWAGFLALYVGAAFSMNLTNPAAPLWAIPLIAWIASYGWFLWRLR